MLVFWSDAVSVSYPRRSLIWERISIAAASTGST